MSRRLLLDTIRAEDAKRLMSDLKVEVYGAAGSHFVDLYREWGSLASASKGIVSKHADELYVPIAYDISWSKIKECDPIQRSEVSFKLQEKLFSAEEQRARGIEEEKIQDQEEIFAEAMAMLPNKRGFAALDVSTGCGKTKTAVHISAALGKKIIVICSNKDVLSQWEDEYKATGVSVAWIGTDGKLSNAQVHVTTVDNASKIKAGDAWDVGTVIYDEAHLWTESCVTLGLLALAPDALILLSATLDRPDGLDKALELYYGKNKVVRILKKDFTLHKCLSKIKADTSKKVSIGGSSRTDYHHAMASVYGNASFAPRVAALCIHVMQKTGRTLAFFNSNASLYAISGALGDIPHAILNKNLKIKDVLKDHQLILCIKPKAKEGVNIPELRSVILVDSGNDIRQQEGRVRGDFFDLWIVIHNAKMFENHWEKAEEWASVRSKGTYKSSTVDMSSLT